MGRDDKMGLIEQIQQAGTANGFGSELIGGGYRMQQSPEEFAQLIEALRGKPINNYLQVGSAAGGSERFICETVGIKSLTIMDLGTHEEFPIWQTVNKPALEAQGVTITQWLGDSHSDEAEYFIDTQGKFDLIGIDGDHTPAGARMDWKLITPCLRPSSLVWIHDIDHTKMRPCDNGAYEVWTELKKQHKVLVEALGHFGIGLVEIV